MQHRILSFQVVIKHKINKSEYELYSVSQASQKFYNMYEIIWIGGQWSEHPIPGQIMWDLQVYKFVTLCYVSHISEADFSDRLKRDSWEIIGSRAYSRSHWGCIKR